MAVNDSIAMHARDALHLAWGNFIELDSMIKAVSAVIEKAENSEPSRSLPAAWAVLHHMSEMCEKFAEHVDQAEVALGMNLPAQATQS